MKWTLFITFFLFVSCALQERMPAQEKLKVKDRHVVFDIDWTIVSEIKNQAVEVTQKKRVVEVGGHRYFINEGLEEFVEELLAHPEIRVSFYSGGKASRNNELLSLIKLRDGRSLKDVAYKILSNEDLVSVPLAPATLPFSERHKKDLTKVTSDLSELVMFDDTATFVLETKAPQSNHVFFIGVAFEYFENYDEVKGMSGPYVPKSYEEWLLNQKKLIVLHGAFKEAYLEAQTKEISFSEAMKKRENLLNLKDHQWNEYSKKYFQDITKSAPATPKASSFLFDCHGGMRALMGL